MTFTPLTSSRPLAQFLTVQCLIASVCSAAWWMSSSSTAPSPSSAASSDFKSEISNLNSSSEDRSRREPTLANEPSSVTPRYDVPEVVSDEQLANVLFKLRPRFRHGQPKINHVDHALRCWGAEVFFADPQFVSGDEMRRLLTDHDAFKEAWGDKTRALLIAKEQGVAYRNQQGDASASHVDHTLGTLAECGTPLDFPIRLAGRSATLRDVLHQALASFDINQAEYEWTTLAVALYATDGRPWYTPEGDRIDFVRLAQRIMRQKYGQGVCFGNHRLYSLTVLLRLDDEKHLLTVTTRQNILAHLTEATRRLTENQHADGYWDRNWHDLKVTANDEDMALGGPLARRILSTGHALEWWAMAPTELHPPRETLVRASQWLVHEIERMSEKSIADNYTFLSHAGRALALWRGRFPASVGRPSEEKSAP